MSSVACTRVLPVLQRKRSGGLGHAVECLTRTNSGVSEGRARSPPFRARRTNSGLSCGDVGVEPTETSNAQPPTMNRVFSNLSIRTHDLENFLSSAQTSPALFGSTQPSPVDGVHSMTRADSQKSTTVSGAPSLSVAIGQYLESTVAEGSSGANFGSECHMEVDRADQQAVQQGVQAEFVFDMGAVGTPMLEGPSQRQQFEGDLPPTGLLQEPQGPFGPYNPAPAWMVAAQRAQRRDSPYTIEAPVETSSPEPDEFEGKVVVMVRGKYKGKRAFVQRKVNKKYRMQVEGVTWGLEFYPNMFALP